MSKHLLDHPALRLVPGVLALLAALALSATAAVAATPYDAEPVRFPAATLADPGERVLLYFEVKNTGTAPWAPGVVALNNTKNPLGSASQFGLNRNVLPNETAYWDFEAHAPTAPGIHESTWQVINANQRIGPAMTCYVIVVPVEAQALRAKIQTLIDEFNAQNGQQVKQLIRQIGDLLAKEGKGVLQQLLGTRCGLAAGHAGGTRSRSGDPATAAPVMQSGVPGASAH